MYKFALKRLPMRTIRQTGNPVPFGVPLDGQDVTDGNFSYREYLLSILSTSREGMDLTEMRKAMDVLKKLDESEDEFVLSFENAEFEWMRDTFKKARFAVVLPQLLELADDLEKATKET